MGSLGGHVVPGVFFIIYGALWCLNAIWYHLRSKTTQKSSSDPRLKKEKSASSSFFEFKRDYDLSRKSWIPFTFTRLPIEPFLKILFPALGLIVEVFFDYRVNDSGKNRLTLIVYSVWDSDGSLAGVSKLHHITMYGSFMLSGMIDVITLCIKLPRQTSMLFLSIAFMVEGLLFYLHTMGRDALNVEIHALLSYVIFTCVAFSVLRIFSPTNLVINLGLGSSILLQGTWFVQAGYILFGGFLDQKSEEHDYVMFVAACFTWHIILVALYDVIVWIAVSLCLRSRLLYKRNARRRGFLAGLRLGWRGNVSEEQSKLIVEEENEGVENEIEMKRVAETRT